MHKAENKTLPSTKPQEINFSIAFSLFVTILCGIVVAYLWKVWQIELIETRLWPGYPFQAVLPNIIIGMIIFIDIHLFFAWVFANIFKISCAKIFIHHKWISLAILFFFLAAKLESIPIWLYYVSIITLGLALIFPLTKIGREKLDSFFNNNKSLFIDWGIIFLFCLIFFFPLLNRTLFLNPHTNWPAHANPITSFAARFKQIWLFKQFSLPLWNPNAYMGALPYERAIIYFSPQIVNFLASLFRHPLVDFAFYYYLIYHYFSFLQILVYGFGFYLFLRKGLELTRISSLVGAVSLILAPQVVCFQMRHEMEFFWFPTFVPLILALVTLAIKHLNVFYALLSSLLFSLSLLWADCHSDVLISGTVFIFAWGLYYAFTYAASLKNYQPLGLLGLTFMNNFLFSLPRGLPLLTSIWMQRSLPRDNFLSGLKPILGIRRFIDSQFIPQYYIDLDLHLYIGSIIFVMCILGVYYIFTKNVKLSKKSVTLDNAAKIYFFFLFWPFFLIVLARFAFVSYFFNRIPVINLVRLGHRAWFYLIELCVIVISCYALDLLKILSFKQLFEKSINGIKNYVISIIFILAPLTYFLGHRTLFTYIPLLVKLLILATLVILIFLRNKKVKIAAIITLLFFDITYHAGLRMDIFQANAPIIKPDLKAQASYLINNEQDLASRKYLNYNIDGFMHNIDVDLKSKLALQMQKEKLNNLVLMQRDDPQYRDKLDFIKEYLADGFNEWENLKLMSSLFNVAEPAFNFGWAEPFSLIKEYSPNYQRFLYYFDDVILSTYFEFVLQHPDVSSIHGIGPSVLALKHFLNPNFKYIINEGFWQQPFKFLHNTLFLEYPFLLSLYNVRYLIVEKPYMDKYFRHYPILSYPFLKKIKEMPWRTTRIIIFENEKVLPRAFLVQKFIEEKPQQFKNISELPFREGIILSLSETEKAYLEQKMREYLKNSAELMEKGYVVIKKIRGNFVLMEVNVTEAYSFLFYSDMYDQGWQAYLDGKTTPIFKANLAFKALLIPQGRHTVFMEYHAKILTAGIIISGLALILELLLTIPKANIAPGENIQ